VSHEKNVVTRSAYLLFYRRRGTFQPPPPTAGPTSNQSDEDDDADFQSAPEDNEEELGTNTSHDAPENTSSQDALANESQYAFDNPSHETVDNSSQDVFDIDLNQGRLVINTSPASEFDENSMELPDLVSPAGLGQYEENCDLGYTDMDSVD